jgi:U3 small nucleolar RNA-associated protein 4
VASWHGQEVTVWKIKKRQNEPNDEKVHRLVARIAVKGDEAIASAAISKDGRLLAVSTVSETRIFRLLPSGNKSIDSLSIQKFEAESPLRGGHSVRISPDQKWLSILSHSNDILVYRLSKHGGAIQVSKRPFRLERVKRGQDSSSLQSYRRAIIRQQFSPDSKVLVVTDISGFVDCWKLEGEEDSSGPEVEMKNPADDVSESSSSDEEEDDEDEDELKSYGQYWQRMESSTMLPQLDSAALILSFRPGKKMKQALQNGVEKTKVNGVIEKSFDGTAEEDDDTDHGLIEQPNDRYELFVLTAYHRLYEFDLSSGKLTDWSRRNTTECLPTAFLKLKDRAVSCYWHTTPDAQRLYIYGSNWLFMFDVLQDFEPDVQSETAEKENGLVEKPRKRKWEGESGAGDKIREDDYVGFRPDVQTTQNGEPVKRRKRDEGQLSGDVKGDEEDHDVLPGRRLRLKEMPEADLNNERDGEGSNEEAEEDKRPRKTWHSFAYRPIFAVIPLKEAVTYVETVLVERPLWELDLPPRLMGPHDKSR